MSGNWFKLGRPGVAKAPKVSLWFSTFGAPESESEPEVKSKETVDEIIKGIQESVLKTYQDLIDKKKAVEEELAKAREEISRLEIDNTLFRTRAVKAENRANMYEDAYYDMDQSLMEAKDTIKFLDSDNAMLESKIEALRDEIEVMSNDLVELGVENDALREEAIIEVTDDMVEIAMIELGLVIDTQMIQHRLGETKFAIRRALEAAFYLEKD